VGRGRAQAETGGQAPGGPPAPGPPGDSRAERPSEAAPPTKAGHHSRARPPALGRWHGAGAGGRDLAQRPGRAFLLTREAAALKIGSEFVRESQPFLPHVGLGDQTMR
jgi:hypothetical protein